MIDVFDSKPRLYSWLHFSQGLHESGYVAGSRVVQRQAYFEFASSSADSVIGWVADGIRLPQSVITWASQFTQFDWSLHEEFDLQIKY